MASERYFYVFTAIWGAISDVIIFKKSSFRIGGGAKKRLITGEEIKKEIPKFHVELKKIKYLSVLHFVPLEKTFICRNADFCFGYQAIFKTF